VKEIDDRTLLTLAMVENLQRADLNPIEEAEGYQRLAEEFGLTQQQIAEVVGKDRTTITSTLRLLGLPAAVRPAALGGRAIGGARARHPPARRRAGDDRPRPRSGGASDERARGGASGARGKRPAGAPGARSRRRWRAERPPRRRRTSARPRCAASRTTCGDTSRPTSPSTLTDATRGEIRLAFYGADDFDRLLDQLGTRPD
jgi:ParB family chromosome partitioning protein